MNDEQQIAPVRAASIDSPSEISTLIADQREHWEITLSANPEMFGAEPSDSGRYAIKRFANDGVTHVLELGAGQGRDSIGFLRAGFKVHAIDYADDAVSSIAVAAGPALVDRLTTSVHDVREPLLFPDDSFDACYSHMLFTMALSTLELKALAREIRRVLRPGGLCIYTVRHIGDAHYGTGRSLGDGLFENGGFVVHFFDRSLVNDLAVGFVVEEVTEFEEGGLPRKLWRVTERKSWPAALEMPLSIIPPRPIN